ncbi:MAG: prolyl aminopeptidase [Alphaproteobacteria bacterium]|nr:prolyl aminopeptidase [Alphaproteobacteria bacterium]MBU1512980.1 prolyl aminopeptidase [Alphaproteobacteria bacterium]MBU2094846.1 prolyl aminopeptidase [Alphaproteobacteria bacterium]MBU2152752.1 prolyl aminopeptidase [Alphaproteobacteria bacterium]MBU2306339.1 prolyl aminopeptidase [Alphaproteobacteria bacterium]
MERNTPAPGVSSHDHRRGLFPDNEAYASGWLATGGPHEIFYEECGNPNGKPCVILHGGPGGAINPTMRRFFDPAKWRMALFDQRGCGKSRPNASLDDNTTWSLIEDIERLREHLGVEKWCVFGGSWGSTLALAYAIKHPDRVESLVLRGIFLLTERELRWFYQDGASMMFPDAWARFCSPIPEAERGDMMAAYHKRLTHLDRRVQAEAAAAWSQWEGDTISIRGPEARPSKFNEIDFAIAFARIECHFFVNGGFFPEHDWLIKNAAKLKDIPGWIVQGRFDVVTPMESAWRLKGAWPSSRFEVVWDAGHASTEPGIVDALVRATDQALRL